MKKSSKRIFLIYSVYHLAYVGDFAKLGDTLIINRELIPNIDIKFLKEKYNVLDVDFWNENKIVSAFPFLSTIFSSNVRRFKNILRNSVVFSFHPMSTISQFARLHALEYNIIEDGSNTFLLEERPKWNTDFPGWISRFLHLTPDFFGQDKKTKNVYVSSEKNIRNFMNNAIVVRNTNRDIDKIFGSVVEKVNKVNFDYLFLLQGPERSDDLRSYDEYNKIMLREILDVANNQKQSILVKHHPRYVNLQIINETKGLKNIVHLTESFPAQLFEKLDCHFKSIISYSSSSAEDLKHIANNVKIIYKKNKRH